MPQKNEHGNIRGVTQHQINVGRNPIEKKDSSIVQQRSPWHANELAPIPIIIRFGEISVDLVTGKTQA